MEVLAERARRGEDRQPLLDDILKIVLDPDVSDDQVGARLRGDIGHERMRAAREARRERLPRDHGHLAMMDASMAYLRQFVPDVLAAVQFDGGPGMDELLRAVRILAGLYAAKARKVPDSAPDGFVPARWAGYLKSAAKSGDVIAYRHYWWFCALSRGGQGIALSPGISLHVVGGPRALLRSATAHMGWSAALLLPAGLPGSSRAGSTASIQARRPGSRAVRTRL
jgi:hypothetical protein